MGGGGERPVAGHDPVQSAPAPRRVGRVADRRVVPEPDHDLVPSRRLDLGVEVAERVARADEFWDAGARAWTKILIPRDDWPSANPACCRPRAPARTRSRRGCSGARRRPPGGRRAPHPRASRPRPHRHMCGRRRPASRGAPRTAPGRRSPRADARVPGRQGDPAAGVLREREAVAGQRMPAQDADRARVLQPAVGERLELCPQHVAVLLVEPELFDPLGDRHPSKRASAVDARSGSCGFGSDSATPSTKRPSPRSRWRRARRSCPPALAPTYQAVCPDRRRARPAARRA